MHVDEPFDVIVVDNDPAASAVPALERFAETSPLAITIVHERRPGISAARNAALDAARQHRLIAFIDDDETADRDWLQTLLDVHRARGCAGVTGPVEYRFEATPPRWALLGGFYMEPGLDDGELAPMAGTNNLLLDLDALRARGLRFDDRFGIIGGSDIVLTRALTDSGGQIVWAAGALVHEFMPAVRCARPWLVRRAVRTGNSYALMHLNRRRSDGLLTRAGLRMLFLGTGLFRILAGSALLVLCPAVNRNHRSAAALRTVLRGFGVLGAALGRRVAEYARPGASTRA